MRQKILHYLLVLMFFAALPVSSVAQMLERVEPEFTTTDRLMRLSAGMTKNQVLSSLEIYPYELLYNTEENCEVQVYKVAIEQRSHFRVQDKEGTRDQLDQGTPYYNEVQDVYVYFKNGLLDVFIVKEKESEIYGLLSFENTLAQACDNKVVTIESIKEYEGGDSPLIVEVAPPVSGCMDEKSLNFNPDAQIDDGSCEYCECGFEPARLSDIEKLADCPPCLPSEQLWNFWIADGRCDLIRQWVTIYPPLFAKVPRNYFASTDCKVSTDDSTECDWCDLINEGELKISTIELENK